MNNKSWIETIADTILFVLVTLPLLAGLITAPFCRGFNEGIMDAGRCTLPVLEGLYNGIGDLSLLLLFGGFIFVVPIILIAAVVSLVAKVRRFFHGYRPKTVLAIIAELVYVIPFVIAAYYIFALLAFVLFSWFSLA